jgi:hypothetical protein
VSKYQPAVTQPITKKKNDPMMLLMAAAKIVDQQSKQGKACR